MLLQPLLRTFGHQNWIRFGIRDRIIRLFDNINVVRPGRSFTVPFFKKMYKGDLSEFVDWQTYYYGAAGGEELMLMRDALTDVAEPVVADIGANVGHHTLFASTVAKQVHSFEPFPKVLAKLKEKLALNATSNVKVHEIGLGETDEELLYSPPSDSNPGNGSFLGNGQTDLPPIYLPIRRGDDYFKACGISKVDFIKADVEGFEPQVLRGLHLTLAQHRPVVFFEWSAHERGLATDPRALFPPGYTIYEFAADRPMLGVFNKKEYVLLKDQPPFQDSNKVAIPTEKLAVLPTLKSRIYSE